MYDRVRRILSNERLMSRIVWLVPALVIILCGVYMVLHHQSKGPLSGGSKSPVAHTMDSQEVSQDLLFEELFSGGNRIVTNEYAHWNPTSTCHQSSIWDMTSGTLLVKDGMGYTGVPTSEAQAKCESTTQNNSNVFRLTTKKHDFGDVHISFDLRLIRQTTKQSNSYDGVHVWLHYQSETALYAASVARWDGSYVVKKKTPLSKSSCPEKSNGGCYTNISGIVHRSAPDTEWHHVDVVLTNSQSKPQIAIYTDGALVVSGVDAKSSSPYRVGSVGIRGDNTEFYFKNFRVYGL